MTTADAARSWPVLVSLLLLCCEPEPPPSPYEARAAKESAGVLLEVDGCKVYRFNDGRNHYFARCPESTTVMETQCHQQGKHLVCLGEEVPTEPMR